MDPSSRSMTTVRDSYVNLLALNYLIPRIGYIGKLSFRSLRSALDLRGAQVGNVAITSGSSFVSAQE
jgi:hypothetical protein